MLNKEIKEAMKRSGLKQWEVAERYSMSEGNFSRLFRRELSEERKTQIMAIIQELQTVGATQ